MRAIDWARDSPPATDVIESRQIRGHPVKHVFKHPAINFMGAAQFLERSNEALRIRTFAGGIIRVTDQAGFRSTAKRFILLYVSSHNRLHKLASQEQPATGEKGIGPSRPVGQ